MSKKKEAKQQIPLLLLLSIILPSCITTNKKTKAALSNQAAFLVESPSLATNIDVEVDTYTAKLDVPLLFGTNVIIGKTKSADQQLLIYETEADHELIIRFYQSEMERLGWQHLATIQSDESVLMFQKPYKIAHISVRAHSSYFSSSSKVHIFIAPHELNRD